MKTGFCIAAFVFFGAPRADAVVAPLTPADFGSSAAKITFETDPLGLPVSRGVLAGSIWSSQGVTFDSNDLVGDPPAGEFTITSPPNVLSGDTVDAFQPIHAMFNPPVSRVGAWGFDFVLEVFDQQGNSLASGRHTDGSPGFFGANEVGFLGFQSSVPIATAEFRRVFPSDQAFGFHIDDLTFQQVPEQATLLLAVFGAATASGRRRRPTSDNRV
jgi:hypothetical protein